MPVTITRRNPRPRYRVRGKLNWLAIKDEWLALKSNGSGLSLKEFAKKRNLNYKYLRVKSSNEKWTAAVEQRVKEVEDKVNEQLIQRSADAITAVRQALASDEMEVRERHATIARGMQTKAINRLNTIPVDHLTAKEAIDLLRIGLEQERRALGIPDEHHVQMSGHVVVSREQEIFEQHLLVHKNVQKAVSDALLLLEDKSDAG
jgi:hypothetical protein